MKLAISHLCRPMPGEVHNGDALFLRQGNEKEALFAVVDALGHGRHAADAAQKAVQTLQSLPPAIGLPEMMEEIHAALAGSRGAAVLLCRVADGMMEGLSIGNVELRSAGGRVPFISSNGVVGHGRLSLKPFSSALTPKTRLAVFSDGLSSKMSLEDTRNLPTDSACTALFNEFSRPNDDATLLLADVLESP